MRVNLRIGIDLMGSENSPKSLSHSLSELSKSTQDSLTLVLFLDALTMSSLSKVYSPEIFQHLEFCLAETVISQEEDPLTAIRQKKNSSLVSGILALRDKKIDAFVTAGNTGALIAASALFLKCEGELKIPVLMARVPSRNGFVSLLDVGGNLVCESGDLIAYAFAGSRHLQSRFGIEKPRVGLLNIGVESKKGTIVHQQAYQELQARSSEENTPFIFCGNIEGRDVFDGGIDLLVTDAFSGNVLLKTAEGMAAFLLDFMREGCEKEIFSSLQSHFDYSKYPGALVCGVEGLLIKCHAAAGPLAMLRSVQEAIALLTC